jgi:hypothetical protein
MILRLQCQTSSDQQKFKHLVKGHQGNIPAMSRSYVKMCSVMEAILDFEPQKKTLKRVILETFLPCNNFITHVSLNYLKIFRQ